MGRLWVPLAKVDQPFRDFHSDFPSWQRVNYIIYHHGRKKEKIKEKNNHLVLNSFRTCQHATLLNSLNNDASPCWHIYIKKNIPKLNYMQNNWMNCAFRVLFFFCVCVFKSRISHCCVIREMRDLKKKNACKISRIATLLDLSANLPKKNKNSEHIFHGQQAPSPRFSIITVHFLYI